MVKCNQLCEWNRYKLGCVKPLHVACPLETALGNSGVANESPVTNGDRVRSMDDAALAEWIVSVIDFALRQNGIVKSSVICAAYKQRFLMHLRRPAEEGEK